MEEAGLLDGDLITHINGECVGLGDNPDDFVWESKVSEDELCQMQPDFKG